MIALRSLAHLPPELALLTLTLGLLLIYVELNRPGWIVPGAIGLSLTLLAIASLLQLSLRTPAILLIASAIALLAINLLRPTSRIIAIAATVALVLGFGDLVRLPSNPPRYTLTAASCGLILAAGTFVLTGIARRARTNKRGKLHQSAF